MNIYGIPHLIKMLINNFYFHHCSILSHRWNIIVTEKILYFFNFLRRKKQSTRTEKEEKMENDNKKRNKSDK
jgi:hypothetical protein